MKDAIFQDHPVYGKVLKVEFESCTWTSIKSDSDSVGNVWHCDKQMPFEEMARITMPDEADRIKSMKQKDITAAAVILAVMAAVAALAIIGCA